MSRRQLAAFAIRPLGAPDLPAYKALRDEMLLAHPDAFTSDAESERRKEPMDYLYRLGLDRREGGQFLIGAWHGSLLVGAVGCEREGRVKVRHIGKVVGLMVRREARGQGLGRALLLACIEAARDGQDLQMLTLTVTAGNQAATRLYERAGFVVYGTLPKAIRLGDRYLDKLHMVRGL